MRKGAARIIAFLMIICIIITGEASTPLLAIADMLNDSPATLSKAVLTSDWDIYRIKVIYGKDAGIPDDAVLVVTELTHKNSPQYEDYIRTGTAVSGAEGSAVDIARVFDISLRSSNTGEEYQPLQDLTVEIGIPSLRLADDMVVDVVHFNESAEGTETTPSGKDGAVPEIMDTEMKGSTAVFSTGGFSVFVVLGYTVESYYRDAEGNNWKVTAHYGPKAGLPEGVEMKVRELEPDELEEYRNQAAEALAVEPEAVRLEKAFDISFEKDGISYHKMGEDIQVEVRLLDRDVSDLMEVIHMGDAAQRLQTESDGTALTFSSDEFSIFIIARGELTRTYNFVNGTDVYNKQVLKNRENLVRPADPSKRGTVFMYWSEMKEEEKDASGNWKEFTGFGEISITETDQSLIQDVTLHAVYEGDRIYITYYDQYGSIYERQEVIKPAPGAVVTVDTAEQVLVPAQDRAGSFVRFDYWTDNPQGGKDQVGTNGVITVSSTSTDIELYPVLRDGHWIYFDGNEEAAGNETVDYIHPLFVENGVDDAAAVLAMVQAECIPKCSGYIFKGWFMHKDNEEDIARAIFVNDKGTLSMPVHSEDATKKNYDKLLDVDGNLANNPTLFAHWEPEKTAKYTVVIWKQKLSADGKTASNEYSYQESIEVADASTLTPVTIAEEYSKRATAGDAAYRAAYEGFHYNSEKSATSIKVNPDGTTIASIYYDRNLHTFTFEKQNGYQVDSNGTYGAVGGYAVRIYRYGSSVYYYVYNYSTSYSGTLYKAVNGQAVAETQYDPSTTYYGSVNGGYTKLTIKSYSGTIYSPKYDRIRTITRPYGAKTIDDFPVVGDDGTIYNGVSWSPSGSAIYNVELMSIQTMPNEDITFRWLREATGKYMHYYLEASGAEDEVGFATRTWEGRTYYEYYKQAHNYDRLIFSVDVSPIDGYNRNVENSDPKFDGNGQISDNIPTNTYFYYNRDTFETIFLDSYEHRDSYIQSRSILFKSTMQDEVDNVEADVAFPKHDGYYFSGWYMDDACTIRVFFHEPSESEKDETKDEEGNYHYEKIDRMPAFPLTVYAGWKPVRYKAIFDPNGGELGGKSGSEINSYESMLEVAHGDTLPEYEDMPRDYVRAGVGSAPTHGYVKDDSTLSYLYRENVNDGERHYVYKQGAYTLVGWHRIHADGREDAKPFTFDTPITDRNTETFPGESLPVIQIRAKWRRSGGFEMVYNANDGDTIVTEPIDEEDYVEGSHAVAMVPVDAPAGKTLDYWVDSLYDFSKPVDDEANRGHSFKPNELVPVSEDIATEASDGTMLVILTAVYRDLNPNTHMMADYIFRVEDNTGGYDIYYLQTIAAGETLVAPVPPEKENYKFTGWYYDTAATRPFKGFGVIDSPVYTTLYAGFKAVYTVNYYLTNTNTGGKTSIVLATQYYTAGEKLDTRHVVHPTDPDHYVLRWRDDADSDPGYFYQSSTVITVTGNMDLFAVLHERNYLHFDSGNGTYVDDEEIPSRGWPVRPADPTRKGYIFEGWYTEKDGGSLYDFDKTLDEAGLDKDNPVLYARWRVDTTNRQKGDIHVIFWAQTADHPVDASSDTVHYQMLCHYDIEDMGYGSYTKEELKSYLAAYTNGSQYDIINTVKTAKANGSDTITYFVEDTLGYKGNNADIIGSWVPNDHIDELNRYFVFSDSKSDGSVTVDDTDSAVLNIRFDLRTFYLEFVPAGKTEIHYAGKTYPTDGSDNYKIPIWLNRPIAHEWPIEDTAEGIPDELAHFEWKDSATLFYSWLMSYEQKYVRPAGSSTVLQTQTNEPHRTPISMTDKLIIDTVIANGTNSTLTLTPESKSPGSVPKTAVVHYLVRNGNTNTFTELPEMQTRISVETKLVPTAQQTGNITNHADYYRFVASVCRVSGHPSQHNGSEYNKFAYRHLEPAAISGYKILENEYAHQGDLLTVDGNQDDGKKDNANMSLLYNLVSNRIAFAQAVFSKSDPIYDAYFKNAPSGQYVDEGEDVYNFYYFYKPAVYKLSFFKNPSEAYGDSQDVFYDMDLDSAIEAFVSIYGEPTPPDGEAVQFGGWAVVPFMTNGDERIDGKGNSMPSYNLNLYAIWEPAQYPVTTKGIDNDNDGNDDVYYAKHNQMLKELPIENPQVEDYFFNGWKLENGRTISGELKITEPTVIVADMVPINTRTITYNINGGTGTLPSDTNKYMVGSKAGIKAGIGLKTDRLDIFNTAYEGTFVSWNTRSDGKGSTYYPGEHMVIPAQKDGESHTITLYAIYSEKRETTLIYDKNAVDARFVEDDDDQADYTPTSGGASILDGTKTSLVLRFRDYKTDNPAIKSAGYPNEPVVIGEDAEKRKFTLVRDGYSFMGWSMSRTATVPDAVNGDMAYVNTLAAGGNTLYAVWAKPLKAYVYVNMGSMKSNTELMDMLGLKYFDSVWAPAGTVDIPATILTGKGDYKDTTDPARTPDLAPEKGKGLITSASSPDDWKTVSKALSEELDRTTLSGDDWENGGLYPSANASNIIGNYAYEVDKQYGKNASSGLFYYKSADDRANHYLNKPVSGDEEPVEFHLEVSFMTAKVKYVYGDNGITEAAAPGRDGTEIDTRVYIRNGDVPEPVSLQGLLPENYSIAGYYCDKEFTKEWHPWSDSEEITVDGKTKTVHRILSRQEKTAQRPLTMNGSEYEWTRVGDEEILTVYVKLNHNGYDVYFAKKDGYGELLDGAGFTVYCESSCTDAGIKMRGTDPVTAVSSGTSVLDSDNVRINGVNILMKKVPSGIWYMKERTLEKDGDGNYVIDGAGNYNSLSGMPSGYELNLKTYILLVGQTALDGYKATDRDTRTDEWRTGGVLAYIGEAQIKSQIGTTNPKMFAIFEIDSDPNSSTYGKAMPASDIARFGIVNESVNKPRIILRKSSPIYSVLSGAHFRIFKLNLEEVTYAWPVGKSHYESTLHSGVFFAGRLPMGKYYIVETRKPDEAKDENTGKVFEMTIDANGVTKKRIGEDLLTGSDVLVTIAGGYEAEIIEKFKAWVRNR